MIDEPSGMRGIGGGADERSPPCARDVGRGSRLISAETWLKPCAGCRKRDPITSGGRGIRGRDKAGFAYGITSLPDRAWNRGAPGSVGVERDAVIAAQARIERKEMEPRRSGDQMRGRQISTPDQSGCLSSVNVAAV